MATSTTAPIIQPATMHIHPHRRQQRGAEYFADVPHDPKRPCGRDVHRPRQRAQPRDAEVRQRCRPAADHGRERPLIERILVAERHGHEQRPRDERKRRGGGLQIRPRRRKEMDQRFRHRRDEEEDQRRLRAKPRQVRRQRDDMLIGEHVHHQQRSMMRNPADTLSSNPDDDRGNGLVHVPPR